jgi:hypothetical protein
MKLETLSTVRDTVNPAGLVTDASYQGVLAYRDGPYRWMPSDVERFLAAGKKVYPISVMGADPHLAQVIDCENGALTVAQAAAWAKHRNELHNDATVYASVSTIAGLVDALGDVPCWLWVAWWAGKPMMPAVELPSHIQIAAVQYATHPAYDESAIISRSWPAHPYQTIAHW